MSSREEFVALHLAGNSTMTLLCRRFGISRKTGYKWAARFKEDSTAGLADRSRRPHASPGRVSAALEQKVVALRHQHQAWGGRKIKRRLEDLGEPGVCSPATVTAILRRHHLIDPVASQQRRTPERFEHRCPNDLWQMDFKGHFPLARGGRCHPLTVLDDHSRYALVLKSCGNEQAATVQQHLSAAFERYGLPRRILCDNGPPWGGGATGGQDHWTMLSLWLVQLGVGMIHGRPRHPQTQGKDERFHATLVAEVLRWRDFDDLVASQAAFDPWREMYNTQRPHEALDLAVPAGRYHPSPRSFPKKLPEIVQPPRIFDSRRRRWRPLGRTLEGEFQQRMLWHYFLGCRTSAILVEAEWDPNTLLPPRTLSRPATGPPIQRRARATARTPSPREIYPLPIRRLLVRFPYRPNFFGTKFRPIPASNIRAITPRRVDK